MKWVDMLIMLQQRLPLAVLKLANCFAVHSCCKLQQRLPLAVLKLSIQSISGSSKVVATALTACGIETDGLFVLASGNNKVATALTACGIETFAIL